MYMHSSFLLSLSSLKVKFRAHRELSDFLESDPEFDNMTYFVTSKVVSPRSENALLHKVLMSLIIFTMLQIKAVRISVVKLTSVEKEKK